MIRVVICDDQEMVREGLRVILKAASDLSIVGTARDGIEAVTLCAEHQPDVVLMDLKMPLMNGIQATRQIREKAPKSHVLVLTTYDADEWVFDAIRAGAVGYLLKDMPAEQLVAAIRGTAAGKAHIDPAVAGKLLAHVANTSASADTHIAADLSEREREILGHLANGLSNAAIAKKLFLSEGTVRNYMTSIFEKLGVSDRTQAAVMATRCGIIAKGGERR
jgi:DNA-binding NarL/FixJ family response regulator